MVPNNSQRRKSSSPALGAQRRRKELRGAQDARENLSQSFLPTEGVSFSAHKRGFQLLQNQGTGQLKRRCLLAFPVLKSEPATWFGKPEILTAATTAARIRKTKLNKDRLLSKSPNWHGICPGEQRQRIWRAKQSTQMQIQEEKKEEVQEER